MGLNNQPSSKTEIVILFFPYPAPHVSQKGTTVEALYL